MALGRLIPKTLISLSKQAFVTELKCNAVAASAFISTNKSTAYNKQPKKGGRVLSQNYVLLQDGLQIQELPFLVRKVDSKDYPFNNMSAAGNEVQRSSEHDLLFESKLRNCTTIYQVFDLLEVPGDTVTTHSAAMALQRLLSLQKNGHEQVDSFVKKAILNELCETVLKGIKALDNNFVLNLTQSFPRSSSFEEKHVQLIVDEIDHRLGDSAFSIDELCTLAHTVSQDYWKNHDLKDNVFIHLGFRYQEIDHFTLKRVYGTMIYVDPSKKYLWKVLDKCMSKCSWKLDSTDVSFIMQTLVNGKHYCASTLSAISKWVAINIHAVKDDEMKKILMGFSHFYFSDANLMKSLECYVDAKIQFMDKNLVGMIMDHCLKIRYLSPRIFEAVASDFTVNYFKYNDTAAFHTLKSFGKLNYLPKKSSKLFLTIESYLTRNFSAFPAVDMIEMLSSFVYIGRFPVNFLQKVYSPLFLAQVRAIPSLPVKYRAAKHLLLLQFAVKTEFPSQWLPYMRSTPVGNVLSAADGRLPSFHGKCRNIMDDIFTPEAVNQFAGLKNTPYQVDFIVMLVKGKPVTWGEARRADPADVQRLAFLCIMPQDYCVNTHHLVGEQAMKQRHLKLMGFTVIEIDYEKFSWKCKKHTSKKAYIKELCETYMQ